MISKMLGVRIRNRVAPILSLTYSYVILHGMQAFLRAVITIFKSFDVFFLSKLFVGIVQSKFFNILMAEP